METWIILLLSYIAIIWTTHLVVGYFKPPSWVVLVLTLIANPFIFLGVLMQTLLDHKKK